MENLELKDKKHLIILNLINSAFPSEDYYHVETTFDKNEEDKFIIEFKNSISTATAIVEETEVGTEIEVSFIDNEGECKELKEKMFLQKIDDKLTRIYEVLDNLRNIIDNNMFRYSFNIKKDYIVAGLENIAINDYDVPTSIERSQNSISVVGISGTCDFEIYSALRSLIISGAEIQIDKKHIRTIADTVINRISRHTDSFQIVFNNNSLEVEKLSNLSVLASVIDSEAVLSLTDGQTVHYWCD